MLVSCNCLKIQMVSDGTIHKAFRTHKQNPLEKFLFSLFSALGGSRGAQQAPKIGLTDFL